VFRTMDQNHLLVDKPAIPRAQIAPTGRPAAGLIAPLAVCFAIESLFQAWWSSVETLVSPITGIYLGYTIDATAVFMMGIAASGMVGLALSEGLLTSTTPRFMAFAGCLLVVAGLLCCVPWFGHLSATSYVRPGQPSRPRAPADSPQPASTDAAPLPCARARAAG
jgi:hypothetical protein